MVGGDLLLVALAGIAAGILGTAGGITSLISYPALLAVGLPPYSANAANLVALVATGPASAIASRTELGGQLRAVRPLLVAAMSGSVGGAVLLLTTPAAWFDRVVPWLVLLGALTLLMQPRISRWRARRGRDRDPRQAVVPVLLTSVYGGYFGAGAGVMLLTACLILVDRRLPVANAIKNILVGASAVSSALVIGLSTEIPWLITLSLAAGLFGGGLVGPRVARRLPADAIRWAVGLLGLALAAQLFTRLL